MKISLTFYLFYEPSLMCQLRQRYVSKAIKIILLLTFQFDMASLIDQQLSSQIKNDQKRSRKRTNSGSRQEQQQQQKVKSYLSRFFSRKSSNTNSKESSQSTTPNIQSPVPPK